MKYCKVKTLHSTSFDTHTHGRFCENESDWCGQKWPNIVGILASIDSPTFFGFYWSQCGTVDVFELEDLW